MKQDWKLVLAGAVKRKQLIRINIVKITIAKDLIKKFLSLLGFGCWGESQQRLGLAGASKMNERKLNTRRYYLHRRLRELYPVHARARIIYVEYSGSDALDKVAQPHHSFIRELLALKRCYIIQTGISVNSMPRKVRNQPSPKKTELLSSN